MRRWVFRAALIAAGLLIGLLIAEGALRGTGRDPLSRILSFPGANHWNAECFTLQDDIGYGYTPGQCGTNSLGFPDRDIALGEGQPRVLVLGDSISADRMFPAFLEQMLTQARGQPVDVVNTGVPGYSPRNEYAVYRRHAAQLQPDLVVLQFCLNDYTGTPFLFWHQGQIIRVRDESNSLWGRNRWWFARSALYRYLTVHAENLSEAPGPASVRFENTESALHSLHSDLGERLVVVIFPYLDEPARWLPPEVEAYDRIRAVLSEAGIQHIDLTEPMLRGGATRIQRRHGPELAADLPGAIRDWGLTEDVIPFIRQQNPQMMKINRVRPGDVDPIHPNFLGHYIAARQIADFIDRNPSILP